MKAGALLAVAAMLAVPAPTAGREPTTFHRRANTASPFSTAVGAGDTLYLSGQIGVRPDGSVPEPIADQARQAMENLRTALALAGATFADVVKCTVMLTDMNDYAAFNRVYLGYFHPDRLPARSAFGVTALAFGAHVEVECVARRPR